MRENKNPIATIPVGQFKARCLTLMKEVNESREPLLITKHGKAIVMVVPVEAPEGVRRFGTMKGRVRYSSDIVAPDKSEWNENA